MDQNRILFYVVAILCSLCIMAGIYKRPKYLIVLLSRGLACGLLVYGIHMMCNKNGIQAPLDLNILSLGTGALLGLPGIIVLYITGIILF